MAFAAVLPRTFDWFNVPMVTLMDRPTIFLSSTIYDFRDLRSAIKDHLEENGCRVLASDYNDFTKPLDVHSYEACLRTIEQADYFLLLIGTRVGGWYNLDNRVSITQQEYRTAYRLAQDGKIKLVSFVREEVWNYRQGSKELSKFLEGLSELDDEIRSKIKSRPTVFASDSEFIVSFIDEVSRNKETTEALKGKGGFPIGNWVHPFSRFSDIRDVVDPLILSGLSVRHAAGRKALQNQLLILLRDVVAMVRDKPMVPIPTIINLSKEINLSTSDITGSVKLSDKTYGRFVYLGMLAPRTALNAKGLESALGTDLLLDYDPKTVSFKATLAYDLLTELLDQIRKYELTLTNFNATEIVQRGLPQNRSSDKSVRIPTHLVAGQFQLFYRWADVANLTTTLVRALEGHAVQWPERMPISPFLDQEVELQKEMVSLKQAREYVGLETEVVSPVAESEEGR
jgi:hypothetical protein